MIAKHGSISEYKPQVKDWPIYAKHLQHYFMANDVTDGDKKERYISLAPLAQQCMD